MSQSDISRIAIDDTNCGYFISVYVLTFQITSFLLLHAEIAVCAFLLVVLNKITGILCCCNCKNAEREKNSHEMEFKYIISKGIYIRVSERDISYHQQ